MLDLARLTEVAGGDAALQHDLLRDFSAVEQADAAVLRAVLAARELPAVERAAHRLRGAAQAVGALPLAEACAALERAARAGDQAAALDAGAVFERQTARLRAHLADRLRGAVAGQPS